MHTPISWIKDIKFMKVQVTYLMKKFMPRKQVTKMCSGKLLETSELYGW